MTYKEIGVLIEEIHKNKGDDEVQHIKEDELYTAFIKYIAKKCPIRSFRGKAKKVLTTKEIDYFSRWCA